MQIETNSKERYVLKKAIELKGKEHQQLVAIEEMSELTKEIVKKFRNKNATNIHLYEEIGDVLIMLKQLIIMYDCSFEVSDVIGYKIKRLADRLGLK